MATEPAPPAMPDFTFSDSSSELSFMSRSPTPPYPSPPSSQLSSRNSPGADVDSSNCTSSAEDDDSRPSKRRRLASAMQRPTKRLDLTNTNAPLDSEQQAELDRLLKVLRKNRKIVIVAGAGISVSAGIPDFRSSTGLFNSLKAQYNLKGSGKHLFDAAVYRDNSSTSSFHDMVRSLSALTKSAKPTPFHHLIARLAREDRLLRLYSQNVDGIDTSLEPLATQVPLPKKGPWPKTIQLHGGLEKMICTKCHELADFEASLFDGPVPPACEKCKEVDYARTEYGGKRSHGIGRLRPRMVLYNEHNPDDEAIGAVTKADLRRRPDAIIVVGTTLKIPGVKRIVREMCSIVRGHRDGLAVWINNDPEPSAKEFEDSWDLIVKGTCDEVARHAAMRHWDDDSEDSVLVTDEEYKLVKAKSEPQVIIETPKKMNRFIDGETLPTPVHSPRPLGLLAAGTSKMLSNGPSSLGKSPTKQIAEAPNRPKIKLNASKSTIKSIAAQKPGAPKKTGAKKPSAAKRGRPPAATSNIKLSFKTKKHQSITEQAEVEKETVPLEKQLVGPVKPHSKDEDPQRPQRSMSIASICNPVLPERPFNAATADHLTPQKRRISPAGLASIRTDSFVTCSDLDEEFVTPQRPPVEPLTPVKLESDSPFTERPIASPLTANKNRQPLGETHSQPNQGQLGPIFCALRDYLPNKHIDRDESRCPFLNE